MITVPGYRLYAYVCVIQINITGLQWMAKWLVRVLLGHDGVQCGRGQDTSEGDGPRTPRTILLGSARNIYIQTQKYIVIIRARMLWH